MFNVFLLISCCWFLPVDDVTKSQKVDLKIVNWNVLYGFNHGKSVEKGAKWIAAQAPSVVALRS